MVRKPSLTAMDYTRRVKPNSENLRVLFYGDKGHGKTHTLTHLIHYLHLQQEHFIIHIREMKKFTRSPWEFSASTSRPGRVDTPLNAAMLLQQFKLQNSALLVKHQEDLLCSQDYKWSLREVTKSGEPLVNVIEHGINRVIHASDCVSVLFKELMMAADSGKIRLASVLDNVRFLFLRECGVLKHADFKKVLVDEMTVARAIKKLIRGSYKNGLVLATCDDKLSPKQDQTPQESIGQEGWDHFDPFLPIHVPKYSREEYETCMNFYQDIGWLTRPESRTREVRDEIRFVSGLNPGQVHYLCQAI
jgi:small subunit ribosomal protein S29